MVIYFSLPLNGKAPNARRRPWDVRFGRGWSTIRLAMTGWSNPPKVALHMKS
jgi:hypothetical protein